MERSFKKLTFFDKPSTFYSHILLHQLFIMKNKFILLFFSSALFFSLPACNSSGSGSREGKLYLRSTFFNGLSLSWIYLGNDGTIVQDPKNGADPVDINLEKQNNADNVGTYKMNDKKMEVTWQNGKTAEWSLEYDKEEISAIDGGIVTLQKGMPSGYMLDGQYAASAMLPNVGQIQTFVFKPNGTFTLNTMGVVRTEDAGSTSEAKTKGTYSIKGNTMKINFDNGQKIVGVITVFGDAAEKKFLVLNNSSFPQEK